MKMTLRKVDLNLLTVFDAIFSEGNLTRAAAQIGMSQPAMSNALSRLRHLTKDELFVREGRGLRPTAGAYDLAPAIRQALRLIEEGLAFTGKFDPTTRTSFQVGGIDYYEVVILPRLLRELDFRSPAHELFATIGNSDELAKPLRHGEIDLLIDYVPLLGSEFSRDVLFEEEMVVLHRREHPDIGDVLNFDDFVANRHALRTVRVDEPAPEVDRVLEAMGCRRDVAVTINNWLALPAAVSNSDLVCTVPRRIAELYAPSFNLVVSALPINVRRVPVYMMWHESKETLSSSRWLRAQFKRACRNI
jgi:DNA-binding transcriptional LysR family regulator